VDNSLDSYKFCPNCKNDLVIEEIDGDTIKNCPNCGFIFWNKSKPVISIIIHKEDKVLLLKRSIEPFLDYWVLPGGFIKSRETAEEAVRRELREETNLVVDIEKIVGTYLIDNDPRGVHLDIIFSGSTKGEVNLNDENKNWQFFSLDTLPEKIAYKHRQAIDDWHASEK
jgi:ADP-ribose pyrophosphatase YjhB (NUDIX family)